MATTDRKLADAEKVLKEINRILKEEDRGIVNVHRMLDRLQKVTNYRGS